MTSAPRPAAAAVAPGHFPASPVAAGHVEPCPRRIRANDGRRWIVDTLDAFHVWEHPFYPQYAVPAAGLPPWLLARGVPAPDDRRLRDHVVLHLDDDMSWFEEDEPVHGHPRSPYVRVDALRSGRTVTVLLPGVDGPGAGSHRRLAVSSAPVGVFETGLPPRWYLARTCVDWSLLTPSDESTRCPYKGVTSDYWNADGLENVAWSYAAPHASVSAIAGLVAFDDDKLEVHVTA